MSPLCAFAAGLMMGVIIALLCVGVAVSIAEGRGRERQEN